MPLNLNIDAVGEQCIAPFAEVRLATDGKTESPSCTQRSIEMLRLLNDVFDGEENASSPHPKTDRADFGRSD
jgi:hypothetical protein